MHQSSRQYSIGDIHICGQLNISRMEKKRKSRNTPRLISLIFLTVVSCLFHKNIIIFLTICSRTNRVYLKTKEKNLYSMHANAHTETHKNEWKRMTMKITTAQRQSAVS